jgi:dienelactone hydrolase
MTFLRRSAKLARHGSHAAAGLNLALLFSASFWFGSSRACAAQEASGPAEIPMREVLVIRSLGRAGRSAIHTDALEAQIVSGAWHAPSAGETIQAPNGARRTWEGAAADKDGVLGRAAPRGGYVYWPVVSPTHRVMILEAAGDNLVYVNGEIRAGDTYSAGYVELPVRLHAGTNDFLFQCARGRLRAKLTTPNGPLVITPGDRTLPDLILGESEPIWCAVVLLNATTHFAHVSVRALTTSSPAHWVSIPPLGMRKAPFLVYPPRVEAAGGCPVEIEATLHSGAQEKQVRSQIALQIRRPDEPYKRTFLSSIDDSVQYYAVNPSPEVDTGAHPPALFLSLHGASVEAIGQARAYSPKKWGQIVCPTNRRPYGFDWEEWGRWDALEVLALAKARYHPDPSRVYLTGHSMGGHGAWQLGVLYPDRFAAIGPSAGWISFTSYVSRNAPPATNIMAQMLRRAAASSDTLSMATNFLQEGVYILHGTEDDNVPVTEARHMTNVLGRFHHDFVYHEQPGVRHWWDISNEPGADCVDWAPMFDFFAHHVIPSDESLRRIRFVTVNPAVTAHLHWVTILAQERQLLPSAVDIRCDPGKRRLVGTTTNVARLWLGLPSLPAGAALSLKLDGQKIENIPWPKRMASHPYPGLLVGREGGRWQLESAFPASDKNPLRSGPFREAFKNHVLFVYATHGTPEENAWALDKARYDEETFWYRGNGSVALMSDTAYLRRMRRAQESSGSRTGGSGTRDVILYGNADCNAAWPVLLASSPVQVHRDSIRIGSHEISGDNLACLFLQPNPRDVRALVGVVSGSGLPGLRLANRMPYFLSGAGFPDCLVVDTSMLTHGLDGVRAAGFFGLDWKVASGQFAWQDEKP